MSIVLPTGYKVDSIKAIFEFAEENIEMVDLGSGSGPFGTTMKNCPLKIIATGYGPIEYLIKFDYNGSTGNVTSINVEYGGKYPALPSPVYEGYTFGGWWYDNSIQVHEGDAIVVNSAHTLVAMWVKNDDALYTVRVHLQGLDGSYGEYRDYTYLDTYGKTVSFSATSITIDGFQYVSHAEEVTSVTIKQDGTSMMEVYYDRIIYNFDLILHYPDSTERESKSEMYGAPIPYPTVRDHYRVTGFYSDQEMTNVISTVPVWTGTDVKEVHVKVEEIRYTIQYSLAGGSFTDESLVPKTFTYTESPIRIPDPVRNGYIFMGWELDGVNIGNAVPAKIERDILLLALWTDVFTITVSDPATGTVSVSGDVTYQGDGTYTTVGVKTVTFTCTSQVYQWIVNGSPVEPSADGSLSLEVGSDVTVYPYLLLIGDTELPTNVFVTVSFGLNRTGSYISGPVGSLIGMSFQKDLDHYGFQDGSVSCSSDGKVILTGLGDATGSIRIFFTVGDGGSTDYIVHLTVNIVSDIVSANTEVSS